MLRALPAIAIGHEASIVLVALLVLGLGVITDPSALHLGAGVALIAFGLFRFVKPRAHFRWVRVTVNRRELTWWSFLMSTAHGAGLMVAPVLIGAGAATEASASSDHAIAAVQENGLSIPGSALGHHAARRRRCSRSWASWRCWSTTTSGSPCSRRRGSTSTRCGRARSCSPGC